MLLPMSSGLIVLIVVMAGNFVYWAINSIINHGMSVTPVLRLFLLAAPGFAVQGIPAGVILAVCLVLNRAVRDNEIIALRVGGASLPRIIAPFPPLTGGSSRKSRRAPMISLKKHS
jgi:lipopolysaccharide export LptBFGC system permease protein LptF